MQAAVGIAGALLLLAAPPRLLVWAALLGTLFAAGSLAALLVSTGDVQQALFSDTFEVLGVIESTAAPLWWQTLWVEVAAVVVLLVLTVLAARRRRR